MHQMIIQRPANSLFTRLQRRWRKWRGFDVNKTHEVDWVWVDQKRYKRVTFTTQQQADDVTRALKALEPTGCFPAHVKTEDQAVWVEYIRKDRFCSVNNDAVALFFPRLYTHQSPAQQQAVHALQTTVSQDLAVLAERGWITEVQQQALQARAEALSPAMIQMGFDYVDAVKKNFIISQGRAIGIDIEALVDHQPLGLGLSKAEYRGLVDAYDVLSQLDDKLVAQYPLVRLAFLAGYFRQKLDQGKQGHIRLSALIDQI